MDSKVVLSAPAHPLWWLLPAAVLAYLNALSAGFQFDDFNVIVDNRAVHSLAAWWQSMPGIRPLLKLSYTLNWVSGWGAPGFHAVNLLLHLLNIGLVWRLSAHIPAPAGWGQGPARQRARLLATLLFALHPIQSESVTYVSGRSMTLMASFALAGLLCWLEAAHRARPARAKSAAALLFAAAILSKEVAVVLPLALLLFGAAKRIGQRDTLLLLGFTGLALFALFLGLDYRHRFTAAPRSLGTNLLSEANAVYYLIGQLVRPLALNIDPDLPELSRWSGLSVLQAGGLGAALLLAWVARRRYTWLSFGIGWFVLLLLPTHSLIPRLDLASERHLYLAALGLYWPAAVFLAGLLQSRPSNWRAIAVALAVAGIAFTHLRNRDYRDEISLWQATVRLSPLSPRAWNNLGYAYYLAGRREHARPAYQEALRLDPGHAKARQNLEALGGPLPATRNVPR